MKKTNQKGISEFLIIVLIVIAIVAAVGVGWWVINLEKETNANLNTSASNLNTDVNTNTTPTSGSKQDHVTPINLVSEWQDYGIYDNKFSKKDERGKPQKITTPFNLSEYYGTLTPYGAFFWKKGEIRTAVDKSKYRPKFDYEFGTKPELQFYSFTTDKFINTPELDLKLEEELYEHIFALHYSTTEPKVLFEIGEYNTTSDEFIPGFYGVSQPTKTRGILYDILTNSIIENNILEIYLSAINKDLTNTRTFGMSWDSTNNIAVGAKTIPGYGPSNYLTVVNLEKGTSQEIGGVGSFNFSDKLELNPKNGRSPDNKWFFLSGISKEGKLDVYLFNTSSFPEPIKSKTGVTINSSVPSADILENWVIEKEFPILIFKNNLVVDFNKD